MIRRARKPHNRGGCLTALFTVRPFHSRAATTAAAAGFASRLAAGLARQTLREPRGRAEIRQELATPVAVTGARARESRGGGDLSPSLGQRPSGSCLFGRTSRTPRQVRSSGVISSAVGAPTSPRNPLRSALGRAGARGSLASHDPSSLSRPIQRVLRQSNHLVNYKRVYPIISISGYISI